MMHTYIMCQWIQPFDIYVCVSEFQAWFICVPVSVCYRLPRYGFCTPWAIALEFNPWWSGSYLHVYLTKWKQFLWCQSWNIQEKLCQQYGCITRSPTPRLLKKEYHCIFLAATGQLYMNGSFCLFVTPFSLCSHHHEIFRNYYQWLKWGPCKRSRSEIKGQSHRAQTQLYHFRTVTPVWIHIWWWNDAQSLILLRRGVLLFFKVIHKISRSHG